MTPKITTENKISFFIGMFVTVLLMLLIEVLFLMEGPQPIETVHIFHEICTSETELRELTFNLEACHEDMKVCEKDYAWRSTQLHIIEDKLGNCQEELKYCQRYCCCESEEK